VKNAASAGRRIYAQTMASCGSFVAMQPLGIIGHIPCRSTGYEGKGELPGYHIAPTLLGDTHESFLTGFIVGV